MFLLRIVVFLSVPVIRPSTVTEKLTKRRQVAHENTLAKMRDEMADINYNIEIKIRLKSEWIKQLFENIQVKTADEITIKLKYSDEKVHYVTAGIIRKFR